MSTTAIVTPYEPEKERRRNELAVKEEKALTRSREDARRNRLTHAKVPLSDCTRSDLPKGSLRMNTTSLYLVKRAAETLGYRLMATERGTTILQHTDNSVVQLSRTESGKIAVSSNKGDLSVGTLIVREYTATQLYNHLKSRGMVVQAQRTTDGEITVEARSNGESTVVTADIRRDGVAVIDVSGVKGRGCQDILNGIARAIEGSQIDTHRKNEFFVENDTRERTRV
jgi:hypothetical protein